MKWIRLAAAALFLAQALALSSCAECSRGDRVFVARGHSLNILFLRIPGDPLRLAESKIPEGATIENVNVSAQDAFSARGFIARLFGVGVAEIGGTLPGD